MLRPPLERHLAAGVLRRRGRTEVGVDPAWVWCDLDWFESLLDADREREALQLYGGELMPGFHLDGCPEFVHWLELERDRLRRRATRAALVLARREGLGRGSTEGMRWLRFAAATSRFEEGVLRDSMRLLAEVEDRPGMASLFREYDARVREDLGMTRPRPFRGGPELLSWRTRRWYDTWPGSRMLPWRRPTRRWPWLRSWRSPLVPGSGPGRIG
jgi:hypothetical protein